MDNFTICLGYSCTEECHPLRHISSWVTMLTGEHTVSKLFVFYSVLRLNIPKKYFYSEETTSQPVSQKYMDSTMNVFSL